MTRKEKAAWEKRLGTSPAASITKHKSQKEFMNLTVNSFVDKLDKQPALPKHHLHFLDSDDETGRYGKARSQPKAESTSPFLTTTNTLPHTHTHKHKGRYEKESKFDIKKPPQASKTESIHFKEPSRPMLTTTNRPSSRGKEVDPNDESIDVQHLQRPFLLNQRRQNDSNESPSRSITKDRRRPSSPESKEKFASSESREKFASPGSRKKFASPGSREKFASPERKKFSSLLKDHRQLQSPTAASPSKLPIKGNVVDLPSDSTAHIESRSLSPPSPPPKLNFEKKNISPKPSRKPTAKRWTESIDSLPDLPETEEEYDALSRRDKVRLGDETIVRRKYRENQRSVCPPSSSAESTQRRTPKEKENEESEKKKSSSGAYQAHHGNSQKGCSEPNSDSDLEDADLFKAQPLGFNAGNKSLYKQASTTVSSDVAATTSPLHSTTLGNFERKAVSTSTESPLKNKGKCTDSTLFKSQSKERRSNESSRTVVDEIELFSSEDSDADFSNSRKARRDPLRGLEGRGGGSNTLVKGVSQDATTKESRASKPMHPTDDDRLIFKGLIPKATHYIGRERLIAKQTRSEGSSANSNTTSKERHESLTTKNRPRDFFDLSNSHKPRSEAPLKPTKATETTFNRNEGLADGNIKRTNIYNRSVKRSPSPSSSSETESTGLSESGFMTSVEQARSRAATPSERGTRKAANKNKDNTEVLTPKSGGFQLPSPRKKKPRMSISSEVMFLSDDDLPNPGLVDTNDADNVCPYCGDALPKVKSARLALALAKVQASLKEKQQQLQPQPQQQNHIVIDLEDDLYNATRDTRNHTLENTSLAPLRGDSIVGKSQPRPRRLDRLKRNTASDTKSSISENEPGEEELGELEEPISPTSPSKGVSLMEKFEFCRVHFAEERIVPLGMEKNYPLHIDFSQLAGRVRKMEGELRKIIDKTEPSIFLEQALSRYKSMGTLGARHPHVVLANVEQTMPGYYGSKGSAELSKILAKLFLETSILTYDLAHPQKPIEYIQQVLVPEAGLRLIVEDQANLKADNVISLEKAREIMFESVEYGNYMYDIHNT